MDDITKFYQDRGFAAESSQIQNPQVQGVDSLLDDTQPVAPLDIQEMKMNQRQVDNVKENIKAKNVELGWNGLKKLRNATSFDSFSDSFKDKRINTTEYDVKLEDVYEELNSGEFTPRFENYIAGTNNEQRLALQQSGWEQAMNGVAKGIAKTGLNVLDGTAGTVIGLGNMLIEGSLSATYNNNFSKWIDDMNTKLDYNLPNYYTQEQKNMGFLSSMTTANFWANDFLGGMSFMLGTLGSEAIWAAATGGASLAVALPKLALRAGAKAMLRSGAKTAGKQFYKNSLKAMKAYGRTIPVSNGMKALNNTRFLYTSAGYEAGVEARHSLDESLESFIGSYQQTFGRKPNAEEYSEFMDEAVDSSNKVFGANVALVGASNILQFGSYFGVGTGLSTGISKAIGKTFGLGIVRSVDDAGKVVYQTLKGTKGSRFLSKTIDVLKAPIQEGFIEEGGQSVINNTSQNWLKARYNPDAMRDNYSLIESAADSFAHTYGTKEGFKEIGLGMLIGAVGSAGKRGADGKRTPFNVGATASQERVNEQLAAGLNKATDQMTTAQKQMIEKLLATNQFNTFITRSKEQSEKGNVTQASIDFDTAQYTKMVMEDSADLLDDSVLDFQKVIESTEDSVLAEQYGLTMEQVAGYKTALMENYESNVALYKEAKDIAEAVSPNLNGFDVKKKDYSKELGLNIFLGVKAAERSNDIADSIEEMVGTTGLASALKLYTNINKRAKRRAERMVVIEDQIKDLESQYAVLQQSFDSASQQKATRVEENSQVADQLNRNEKARLKLTEQLAKKRNELTELQSKLENKFQKSKFAFGGRFNIFGQASLESEFITDQQLSDSVRELEKLDEYKKILKEENPAAYAALESLTQDYVKNVKAFRDFNIVFESMSDPRFANKEYKGVVSLFPNQGTEFKEGNLVADELDVRSKAIQNYIDANKDNLTEEDIFTLRTIERITTASKINLNMVGDRGAVEVISNDDYNQFIDNGEVSTEILTTIANKIKETGDDSLFSKREKEIFAAKITEINEILQDILLQEGDPITSAQQSNTGNTNNQQQTTATPTTLVGRIKQVIQKVKDSNSYLDEFNPEEVTAEDKPTDREYREYDKLVKKSKTGKMTPRNITRMNNLKAKINNWGRLEGTLASKGIQLSDLLEQVALLESQQITEEEVLPSVTNLEDILDADEFSPADRNSNYDNLQTYDKAFVSVDNEGNYSISNINLSGVLNIMAADQEISVHRNGKKLRTPNKGWDLNDLEIGDKFTVSYLVDGKAEKILFKIGSGNNVVMSTASKNKLNDNFSLKIMPSNNLPVNYQPLLREVTEGNKVKLVPVNSNFTFSRGQQIDVEAIYNLEEDSLVYLEVDTSDSYNQKLLEDYRNATGKAKAKALKALESSMVIYVKDKSNNLLGVHKAAPNSENESDENLVKLQEIRKIAVGRVLEEQGAENEVIDLGISIPVAKVYQGHPDFNIVNDNGKIIVEDIPFTDANLGKVLDIGYTFNGEVVLKKDTKGASSYPFAVSLLRDKRYKNKKVPVAVIDFRGQKLVYPIKLNPVDSNATEQMDDLLNTNLGTQDLILGLNQLLIDNKVDVDKYGFSPDNLTQDNFDRTREVLEKVKDFPNITEWIGSALSAEEILRDQATINIDVTDAPFHSPKIRTKIQEVNGLDSQFMVDLDVQEVLPSEVEGDVTAEQNEDC